MVTLDHCTQAPGRCFTEATVCKTQTDFTNKQRAQIKSKPLI